MEQGTIVAMILFAVSAFGFVWGLSEAFTKLKMKPSEEKVDKMIDERFTNHCPFKEKIDSLGGVHLEKIIDERIDLHPLLKQYSITQYRIDQLEPDVRQIKSDIQNILFELAKGKN